MEIKNVKRDMYGNSRYVVHFLAFSDTFKEAHKMAKKIGGSKYRGKDFGGGLVFQAHSEKDLENLINGFLETNEILKAVI